MRTRLLERDAELGLLRESLGWAGRGGGSVVLVSGEPGIGKTSLVRAFAEAVRDEARVLVGECDDLATPRTLGPFRDMARGAGGPLAQAVRPGAERDEIFGAALRELERGPTVMVVEDVHWADDATLDVLRYLVRRIAELPGVLVLTYRDDDVGGDHPLRQVLGLLAGQDVRRIALGRLSRGAEAASAGAFHEALAHYELVLRWSGPLLDERRARIMEESVWVLYDLYRFGQAAERARQVVGMYERIGDRAALGQALTTLSRTLYMVNDPVGSEEAATRAVALLEPLADLPRLAHAYSYLAAILKLTDRLEEAIARAEQALRLAELTGQPDVVSHSLNYLGFSLLDRGDLRGAEHLRRAAAIARSAHHYEYAQRAYTNLVEGLYRLGRFRDLDEPLQEGLAYAREYGFASHEYNLEAHRCMLLTLRGQWDQAEAGLRRLLAGGDPGVLASFGLSALGRLLARKEDPGAGALLERAWHAATQTNSVQSIALAGIARVEWAWLSGDHQGALALAEVPLERAAGPGAERYRGELLRYLARCGHPAGVFPGCPREYALGIEGDWRGAAAAWETLGAPHERALELAGSGRQQEMLEAIAVLDRLGAVAAGDMVRRRLRRMGVTRLPRRPLPRTRANPAGLTDRQVEVLELLTQGLTNAEIADRLVVSVRTVDHHVAAILAKLNVTSRREAARVYAIADVT